MSRTKSLRNAQKRELVGLMEGDIRYALLTVGMSLRVSRPSLGHRAKVETFHWMVEDDTGRRVVDFWPVSGTWYCRDRDERGHLEDPFDIVDIACKLASAPR